MAACGYAATSTTYLIFNLENNYQLAILIALAAMLDYHLQWQNINTLKEVWLHYTSKQLHWLVLSLILLLAFWYKLSTVQLLFASHLFVLAFFYGYEFQIGSVKIPALRNVDYLKIFLIVYVWVAFTLWMPLLGTNIPLKSIMIETAQRALFYLALTLPFDIRDEHTDRKQALKTVANKLGDIKSKWLSAICLFLSFAIAAIEYQGTFLYAIAISHSICLFLVLLAKKSRSLLFYTVFMDGTIVLQYLVMLVLKTVL